MYSQSSSSPHVCGLWTKQTQNGARARSAPAPVSMTGSAFSLCHCMQLGEKYIKAGKLPAL